MPPKYSRWAKGLSDLDVAYALLGLGLIPVRLWQKPAPALAAEAELLGKPDVHTWKFDATPAKAPWAKYPAAAAIAAVVLEAAQRTTQRFSLSRDSGLAPLEMWNRVRKAVPATHAALHIACEPSRRRVRFRWPLRIGFLPGPDAERWRRALDARDAWNGNVFQTLVLSRRATECDLLVCTSHVAGAQPDIARARREFGDVRADVIAVFAPRGVRTADTLDRLDAIRGSANADGIALFDTSTLEPVEQLRSLCMELSHNHPLDVALSRATSGSALLMASRPLLDASVLLTKTTNLATALGSGPHAEAAVDPRRLGNWGAAMEIESTPAADAGSGQAIGYGQAARRERSAGRAGLRPPPRKAPRPVRSLARPGPGPRAPSDSAPMPPPPPPPQPAPRSMQRAKPPGPTRADMGRFLRNHADKFPWIHESSDASALGTVMRTLAEEDEQLSGARFLQAAFATADQPEAPLTTPLKASSAYVVNVFVGPPRAGFVSGDVAFPDLPPPDDGRAHELDVVFWEPTLCKKPMVRRMDLPPLGASEPCRFALRTRATTTAINARITILHRNRVLQTGTLKAPVGSAGEVTFELDAIPRRLLSGLDDRTNFSMAMVLNDTEGEGQVHVMRDGEAQTFAADHSSVTDLTDAVNAAISGITAEPDKFKGLRSAGSQALLLDLAAKGASLHGYLERYLVKGGTLIAPDHVQLVMTKPKKVFPLEFVYDYPAPDLGAKLCANAEAALKAGDCLPKCARHKNPQKMDGVVCPFGFWGLRCVIERKLHDEKKDAAAAELAGAAEPVKGRREILRPLVSVLVGASPRADEEVKGSVKKMLARIQKIDRKAKRVTEWTKWPAAIEAARPATLALVVHQASDDTGTPSLEIGPPPMLNSNFLARKYVTAADSRTPPIVLLIGCETANAMVDYESFTTKFQWWGAAVVSTIAKVMGRQAAPLAADILDAIKRVKKPTSFAVVMRDVRRKALADGTPMVLGLISNGDADWEVVGS